MPNEAGEEVGQSDNNNGLWRGPIRPISMTKAEGSAPYHVVNGHHHLLVLCLTLALAFLLALFHVFACANERTGRSLSKPCHCPPLTKESYVSKS